MLKPSDIFHLRAWPAMQLACGPSIGGVDGRRQGLSWGLTLGKRSGPQPTIVGVPSHVIPFFFSSSWRTAFLGLPMPSETQAGAQCSDTVSRSCGLKDPCRNPWDSQTQAMRPQMRLPGAVEPQGPRDQHWASNTLDSIRACYFQEKSFQEHPRTQTVGLRRGHNF